MRKAIFLDRDGVLNKTVKYKNISIPPKDLSQLQLMEGIKNQLVILKKLKFLLLVVTNQPDVARGNQKKSNVVEINNYLKKKLFLDDIFVCWHEKDGICECRKPKPGLFLKAQKKYNIKLEESYMIGDRFTDVIAGKNAGCKTILMLNLMENQRNLNADFSAKNMEEAVNWIKTVK